MQTGQLLAELPQPPGGRVVAGGLGGLQPSRGSYVPPLSPATIGDCAMLYILHDYRVL
jgi:hypothetical protein